MLTIKCIASSQKHFENACNQIIYINSGLNYEGTAPFLNFYDIYRYCALAIRNDKIVNKKDFLIIR